MPVSLRNKLPPSSLLEILHELVQNTRAQQNGRRTEGALQIHGLRRGPDTSACVCKVHRIHTSPWVNYGSRQIHQRSGSR